MTTFQEFAKQHREYTADYYFYFDKRVKDAHRFVEVAKQFGLDNEQIKMIRNNEVKIKKITFVQLSDLRLVIRMSGLLPLFDTEPRQRYE